jgi:Ca2+-binding RTX toxin-like protein
MGGKRYYTVSAVLGLGTLLASCAADGNSGSKGLASGPKVIEGDWGDETKYPEYGGAFSNLTAAGLTSCVFTAKTGALVVELDGSPQTVVVAKRAADSLLLINGDHKVCDDSITQLPTTVSTKNIKTVSITDAAANVAQNVVLDFLAGTFGAGAKAKAGITVDLGAGAAVDTLAIRGTSGKDTFAVGDTGVAVGSTGFAINSDAFADVDMVGVDALTVSLAGGDDIFTGQGGSGTGAAFATALTVFGGADKDNLTGGNDDDMVYGGAGDDTVTGGPGDDVINGDDGDDVVTQGAAPDGADTIICGNGYKDKVSYALRGDSTNGATEKVTVTVGTPWGDLDSDPSTPDVPLLPNDGDLGGLGEKDDIGTTCEILVGGMGDDSLTGDDSTSKGFATPNTIGGDTIYGGGGSDMLYGGQGNDILYGEAGDDTFVETKLVDGDSNNTLDIDYTAQATTGQDTFVGGDGMDTIDYSARQAALLVMMDGDPKTILTVLAAVNTSKNDGETGEFDNVCTDVENILGGAGNDKLTGNALANKMNGGAGNDELYGLAGDDTFDEQHGWDASVLAAAVPVAIDDAASSGNDKISGGEGVDTVDYSARSVALDVDMVGTVAAADADDGASGLETDDVFADCENLIGGVGANTLVGNDSDNVITGGAAADSISGGKGNDTLFGLAGDDTLAGGDGDDTIDGGADQVAAFTTCGDGDDVTFNAFIDPTELAACEIHF